MKTNDLIQLAALGVVGYLAWQKFGSAKSPPTPAGPGAASIQPSLQRVGVAIDQPDFGLSDSSSWDDTPSPSVSQELLAWMGL